MKLIAPRSFSVPRSRAILRMVIVGLAAALALSGLTGPAAAEPDVSRITSISKEGRHWVAQVYSAAMDKEIEVQIQRAPDSSTPAPNLYLLNGLDGGEGDAHWIAKTKALEFLSNKQVNVILPMGGFASYYTDWRQDDPVLGRNKWKTFFTEELPPLLDNTLGATGRNALAGLSTSGTSVLQLAESKPGLWGAVAAYSGCAQIADPAGQQFVKLSVETWGGGDTNNMYGPANSPLWVENDPVINAEKLRGTKLYISSGSGIPMMEDVQWYMNNGGPVTLTLGMVIEAAVNGCTANLKNKLDSLNIPATYQFNPVGTHYWPYWEEALHKSWPVLAEGMGIQP